MPGPIKPDEVQQAKNESLPEEVFEVFNALIVENWSDSKAEIFQRAAVDRIASALNIHSDEVFRRGLLDIEDVYRKSGWKVEYYKPSYNESGTAYFTFRK